MNRTIDKEKLRRKFSRNARQYDTYASVQKRMAVLLSEMIDIPPDRHVSILEIGCGTGYLTGILADKFPNAHICGVDIADGMIELVSEKLGSEKIKFICSDAEEMEMSDKFDIIISNATFQWFNSPYESIRKFINSLKSDGSLIFSTFTSGTFNELHQSITEARKLLGVERRTVHGQEFMSEDELVNLCEKSLAGSGKNGSIQASTSSETEFFHSCLDFLNSVKKIGASNSSAGSDDIVPGLIDRAIEIYDSNYRVEERNEVAATYCCTYIHIRTD
jgi:malonyl-CoA O-methyltransferase